MAVRTFIRKLWVVLPALEILFYLAELQLLNFSSACAGLVPVSLPLSFCNSIKPVYILYFKVYAEIHCTSFYFLRYLTHDDPACGIEYYINSNSGYFINSQRLLGV
jgi:hypothetical protein